MTSTQDILGVSFTASGDMISAYIVEHSLEMERANTDIPFPPEDYCSVYIGCFKPKYESGRKVEKFHCFTTFDCASKEEALNAWKGRRKGDKRVEEEL